MIGGQSVWQPVYTPRSQYQQILKRDQASVSQLALNFDKEIIESMRQHFERNGWSLSLQKFIDIARDLFSPVSGDQENRYIMTRCLVNLFCQIDLDGSKTLQWDQFTNFIIERAKTVKNNASKAANLARQISAETHCFREHFENLQRACVGEQRESVMAFEYGKDLIYFLNYRTFKVKKVSLSEYISDKEGFNPYIVDILFIKTKKQNYLVTATSDNKVRGWLVKDYKLRLANLNDSQIHKFEFRFKNQLHILSWDEIAEVIYIGHKDGSISSWSIKADIKKVLAQDPTKPRPEVELGHAGVIMCLESISNMRLLASGGIDGKVMLWQTMSLKKKYVYNQHCHGVLCLAYSKSNCLLFSGALDHKICVWNPYIQSLIYKIQGNSFAINSLKVLRDNLLLSYDSEGQAKLIDIKTYSTVYNFLVKVSDEKSKMSDVLILGEEFLFCGKLVKLFKYTKEFKPYIADPEELGCCRYSALHLSFYLSANCKITVWSALTGVITQVFSDLTKSPISCLKIDLQQKRLLIGSKSGQLLTANILNGSKLCQYPKHPSQILNIEQTKQNGANVLISISTDRTIRISADTSLTGSSVIRQIKLNFELELTTVTYLEFQKCLAIGLGRGVLGMYQIQNGTIIQSVATGQITNIMQVSNYPFVLSTYSSGLIVLYMTGPFIYKLCKVFTVINLDSHSKKQSGVLRSCFDSNCKRLFTVDSNNMIRSYNFQEVFAQLQSFRLDRFNESLIYTKPSVKNSSIKIDWQFFTQQTVNFIDFAIDGSMLVITTAEKTVRVLDKLTGRVVQSLQQGRTRESIRVVGYLNSLDGRIYKQDFATAIDDENHNYSNTFQLQFDPFINYQRIDKQHLAHSPPHWKLHVDFAAVYLQRDSVLKKAVRLRNQHKERKFENKRVKLIRNKDNNSLSVSICAPNQHQQQVRRESAKPTRTDRQQRTLYRQKNNTSLPQIISSAKLGFQPIKLTQIKQSRKVVPHQIRKRNIHQDIRKRQKQLEAIDSLCQKLPPSNRVVAKRLTGLLKDIDRIAVIN